MDQKLIEEVKAWISTDPDPKTAQQLQHWLDSHDEENLRQDRKSTRLNSSH